MKSHHLNITETGILTRMVHDYLTKAPCLDGFAKYPIEFNAFEQVIADKRQDTLHRETLVKVLERQYHEAGLDDKPMENILLLRNENTFTITTAHQPNIFTGYLFFVYKILCAINVAEQLKAKHPNLNFVPIYWIGSEDHDFEEISSINFFGERLQWEHEHGGPVGRLDTEGLSSLIDVMEGKLGSQPHAKELIILLREAYSRSTLAEATRYLVHHLFGKYGLVVLNQDDAELKQLFIPTLKDEVLNSRVSPMVQETIDYINRCNYKIQASPREINCFYTGTGKRERIVFDENDKRYHVLNTSVVFTKEEIALDLDAHPRDYSPNVFLRPLFQETVLPNLAYVGGGGEVSYWLELKALFEHYKVNYPMLILRSSLAILDRGAQKKLDKLGIEVKELFKEEELLVTEYVRNHTNHELGLQKEKEQITALFAGILEKASSVDSTLEKTVEGQKQAIVNILEGLEAKIVRAEKRNFETAANQLRALRAKLFPAGMLQERYENFIPYYAAYGPAWIDEVKQHCNPFNKEFVVLVEE